MLKKGTKTYSILKNKCPRCHEGNLFVQPGDKHYNIFGYTPDNCPVCNQAFILEPGFYYGAMYISYVLAVAMMLPVFILFYAGFDFSFRKTLLIVIVLQLLLTPWLYKISRSLWINMFVNYDKDYLPAKP
jgi:uncharacterized protein (DUF983 family)